MKIIETDRSDIVYNVVLNILNQFEKGCIGKTITQEFIDEWRDKLNGVYTDITIDKLENKLGKR